MNRRLLAVTLFALANTAATIARAHAHLPASLDVRQVGSDRYAATFQRSSASRAVLGVDWPDACRASVRATRTESGKVVDELDVVCDGPLAGRTLRVFGLTSTESSVVLHLDVDGAGSVRALLTPERPSFAVPRRQPAADVLRDYGRLGVVHLLTGADHVLFVAGLLLVVARLRARLLALTAFTLGHSVTLGLAAFSVIALPPALVELGIALSLVWLALEAVRGRSDDERPARFTAVPFAFGLVHGLGFAGALSGAGLPPSAVPLSLFAFNAGIEAGQLAVAVALLAVARLLPKRGGTAASPARIAAGYAIGATAAMWCLERLAPLVVRG